MPDGGNERENEMPRAGNNARKSLPVLALVIGAAAVISKYRLHEHLRLTYKRFERKLHTLPFNQRKLAGAAQARFATEASFSGQSIPQDVIDLAQSPGRHHIGLTLGFGDMVHIVVDDDPSLTSDQMSVTLDVNAPQVSWAKEVEEWALKPVRGPRGGTVLVFDSLLGKVRAEMISVPFGTGVICVGPNDTTNWTNNCSNGQTMILARPPGDSRMVFRKTGFLGAWQYAGALNSSVWAAFGGKRTRFIWETD